MRGKGKLETPSKESPDNQAQKLDHKFKTDKLEAGWLGGFFGKGDQQKNNIIGFTCALLIFCGLVFMFLNSDKSLDFWKTISVPVISGAFGYLYGHGKK